MADEVRLYISSVHDLEMERELLTRSVVEIPVSLAWRIEMTPLREYLPKNETSASRVILSSQRYTSSKGKLIKPQ
ncbi:MAG: hypothetical protein IBX69_06425 [Anaerolineales bacterium]|nr:hypothetical protein [Anaerolineales bacterium]